VTQHDLTSNCEALAPRILRSENNIRPVSAFLRIGVVILVALCFTGCSTFRSDHPAAADTGTGTNVNVGNRYGLLFDLVGSEKDLSKLRFVKHEAPALKNLANAIAATNRIAYHELEKLGKSDPSLNLKQTGLPSGEVKARDSISKTKEKWLLSSKGKEFQLQLLLSQNEALTYGSHLAVTTAAIEANPTRKQLLERIGADLTNLQGQVFQMILKNYAGIPEK
jgi:hypothetical protein